MHAPEQRILIGATGLAIQPFIDLNNKNVDKETRKTSAWRTAAKIIAGTIVGVAVRYWGIAFVKKYAQYDTIIKNGMVCSFGRRVYILEKEEIEEVQIELIKE